MAHRNVLPSWAHWNGQGLPWRREWSRRLWSINFFVLSSPSHFAAAGRTRLAASSGVNPSLTQQIGITIWAESSPWENETSRDLGPHTRGPYTRMATLMVATTGMERGPLLHLLLLALLLPFLTPSPATGILSSSLTFAFAEGVDISLACPGQCFSVVVRINCPCFSSKWLQAVSFLFI
ncbi:hypothetical protein CDAR_184691 [Caerostris darwini]|uniref:Uncharacterized protein n=1 Tax=Caerostris darwini TaxID=1538125 RepID=A0AAV4VWE5_9ARAC|nr:hypothetical protein CDAR_184691 [Caerostris darwini]